MVFIDGRKNQYKEYILKVSDFVAPDAVIVIDDAIKFAHKTSSLYDFLLENQIEYDLHKLDEDDGIIVIYNAGKQLEKVKSAA
jgi:predicted O-methyltransferase YrrM